ncbi:oxidoreductase [Longispora fulva]|uniref:Putative dehydrogenase n=1 Tax=Longispora fulva TaxID=619741 RepID=A0A8J7KIW0_9ACTN|nr:Gfo/Idh/MocA family oxidoreductase [Longispora fulva]MBG6136324.1 putative dehydrogenase [Longispora fulva]GIG63167.1 oxidoreductase [Longispora fulva]
MIKIAVVGCGQIAQRWLRVLTAHPKVSVTALVDTDLAAARRLHALGQVDAVTATTVHQALALANVEAIVNLTPPAAEPEMTRLGLTLGLHVLAEKPLTVRAAPAQALIAHAEQVGRRLMVMRNRAFDPGYSAFVRSVAGRGPLLAAGETFVQLRAPGFRTAHTALADLGVHAIEQARRLTDAPVIAVRCTEHPAAHLAPHAGLVTLLLEFADETVVSWRGGYAGPGLRTPANGRWSADTATGSATFDGQRQLRVGDEMVELEPAAPGYELCIGDMLAVLTGGSITPASVSATDHATSISVLEAATLSLSTGDRIQLAGTR